VNIRKEHALAYLRSDISALGDPSDEADFFHRKARIDGQVGLLMALGVLSEDEAVAIGDEVGAARKRAAKILGN